jgi:hypothetical protein
MEKLQFSTSDFSAARFHHERKVILQEEVPRIEGYAE